jgi:hypothetical protein
MEARIHLEAPAPPCCSACYQPQPQKRHVDFGASTDGPVTDVIPVGAIGVVGHVIDEIVLCEDCIKEAAALLGLGDVTELQARLEAAETTNDALHEQLRGQRDSVTSALDTLKAHVTGETPPPTVPNSLLPIAPHPPTKKPAARKRKAATR